MRIDSIAAPTASSPDDPPVAIVRLTPRNLCQIAACPAGALSTVFAKSSGLA
jgi:hypothetical protein